MPSSERAHYVSQKDKDLAQILWTLRYADAQDLLVLSRRYAGKDKTDDQIPRRRMRALEALGYVAATPINSEKNELISKKLFRLTQRGADYFHTRFGIGDGRTRIAPSEQKKNFWHDVELKKVLVAEMLQLPAAGIRIVWSKIYRHQLHWRGRGYKVEPDLGELFAHERGEDFWFTEFQRTESGFDKERGVMDDIAKCLDLVEYAKTGDFKRLHSDTGNFRVRFVYPSWDKAQKFVGRLAAHGADLSTRRFWATALPLIEQNAAGPIYIGPREEEPRSLLDIMR